MSVIGIKTIKFKKILIITITIRNCTKHIIQNIVGDEVINKNNKNKRAIHKILIQINYQFGHKYTF